jgi:hypothetical protein
MATSFEASIENFIRKAKKNPELVVRQVTIKLYSQIILASPVDTGRFRMNWQASYGKPKDGILIANDPTGARAISNVTEFVLNNPKWDEFRLTNNLPYAEVLEFGGYPGDGPNTVGGFSKQAPNGMVRVNVARFQRLIDEAAARMT